jgi:hypothetical protein
MSLPSDWPSACAASAVWMGEISDVVEGILYLDQASLVTGERRCTSTAVRRRGIETPGC